jgi:hypothetical protein
MTGHRLLIWIATAGSAGVSGSAVSAWARTQGHTPNAASKVLSRAVDRGLVSVEGAGFRSTGQAIRIYRLTVTGRASLGLQSSESQQDSRIRRAS